MTQIEKEMLKPNTHTPISNSPFIKPSNLSQKQKDFVLEGQSNHQCQVIVSHGTKEYSHSITRTEDEFVRAIDDEGNILLCTKENGVLIPIKPQGNVATFYKKALREASLLKPSQLESIDPDNLTHIELAAIALAATAAKGDLEATKELFDRELGKSKQISENKDLIMTTTLDEVLRALNPQAPSRDVVDVGVEVDQ
jgi:hypothetical protein